MFFNGIAYFFLSIIATLITTIITIIIQRRLTNVLFRLFSQPRFVYILLVVVGFVL